MEDLENVLKESLEYYQEQERIIISKLSLLPKGRIKKKVVNANIYYYLQYRKMDKVIDEYLGKKIPEQLKNDLQIRTKLEKELRKVRNALKLMNNQKYPVFDLSANITQILKKFTDYKIWDSGIEVIGSWCFLIYQKYLPMAKYPLRTQDLDILIPYPYKGKPFDLSSIFRELGFEERFKPDGSIHFSTSSLKVEFLAPKKSSKDNEPVHLKRLSVNPQFVNFVNMLLDDSIDVKISKGIKVKLPAPNTFFLHKLLVSTRPLRKEKKIKDLRQAIHVGKYILSKTNERKKLRKKWESLPNKWRKKIMNSLLSALESVPSETSAIEELEKILK